MTKQLCLSTVKVFWFYSSLGDYLNFKSIQVERKVEYRIRPQYCIVRLGVPQLIFKLLQMLKAHLYKCFDSLNGPFPANMYIWDPYGQNLGIYPIRVLHGPHIGFFAHIRPI